MGSDWDPYTSHQTYITNTLTNSQHDAIFHTLKPRPTRLSTQLTRLIFLIILPQNVLYDATEARRAKILTIFFCPYSQSAPQYRVMCWLYLKKCHRVVHIRVTVLIMTMRSKYFLTIKSLSNIFYEFKPYPSHIGFFSNIPNDTNTPIK